MEGGDENAVAKPETISIIVKDQNNAEVTFKIKMTTRFEKVIKAYAEKKSQDPGTLRFVFEGQRISGEQTPEQLGIEDGDTIDCFIEQVGGSFL